MLRGQQVSKAKMALTSYNRPQQKGTILYSNTTKLTIGLIFMTFRFIIRFSVEKLCTQIIQTSNKRRNWKFVVCVKDHNRDWIV